MQFTLLTSFLAGHMPDRYLSEIAKANHQGAERLLKQLSDQKEKLAELADNLSRLDLSYEQLQERYRALQSDNAALIREINDLARGRVKESHNLNELRKQLTQAVERSSLVLDLYAAEQRKAFELDCKSTEQRHRLSRLEAHLSRLAWAHGRDRTSLVLSDTVQFPVVIEEWMVPAGQYFDKGQTLCRTNRGVFSWELAGIIEIIRTDIGTQVAQAGDAIADVLVLER